MREPLNDKKRLEHILEAIDRLQIHAGKLSREELESDVLRYYGIKESNNITSVSFSPDDKYILSATGYEWNSANGNTKVWNAEDGMLISLLESFEGLVNYAKSNRKGTMIASARSDGVVKIWDWNNLETIMSETRERFKNRQLTTEERKKYYLD